MPKVPRIVTAIFMELLIEVSKFIHHNGLSLSIKLQQSWLLDHDKALRCNVDGDDKG